MNEGFIREIAFLVVTMGRLTKSFRSEDLKITGELACKVNERFMKRNQLLSCGNGSFDQEFQLRGSQNRWRACL